MLPNTVESESSLPKALGKLYTQYGYVCFLALLAIFAYLPTIRNDFVQYDDIYYITENPLVNAGLTGTGFLKAFVTLAQGNWHPLAWISHQIDVSLFGMNAGGHHAMGAVLHFANGILLYLFCRRIPMERGLSASVAGLFLLHPLHVESVAWASERKDLVCAFFFLLTLIAYQAYARKGGPGSYLLALGCCAAALMGKSMAVTLPLLLLLYDWWPLERQKNCTVVRLVAEKVPFLMLSAGTAALAIYSQRISGALHMGRPPGLAANLANAVRSTAMYLGKMVWPQDLAPLYLFPASIPLWQLALSVTVVVTLVTVALRFRLERPWLLWGGAWYLVTLLPVLGLVHFGVQAWADRYSYLPLIGVFLAVGKEGEMLSDRYPRLVAGTVVAIMVALSVLTFKQVGIWHDSETLFRAAIARTDNNYVMMHNLGDALMSSGREEEGVKWHLAATSLNRNDPESHFAYGNALLQRGEFQAASTEFREALRLGPSKLTVPKIHNNLGTALLNLGRRDEALAAYLEAQKLAPKSRTVRKNIEALLQDSGAPASAKNPPPSP